MDASSSSSFQNENHIFRKIRARRNSQRISSNSRLLLTSARVEDFVNDGQSSQTSHPINHSASSEQEAENYHESAVRDSGNNFGPNQGQSRNIKDTSSVSSVSDYISRESLNSGLSVSISSDDAASVLTVRLLEAREIPMANSKIKQFPHTSITSGPSSPSTAPARPERSPNERHFSGVAASTSYDSHDGTGYQCDDCRLTGPNRLWCDDCKFVYCLRCWTKPAAHRNGAGIVHEKTSIDLYRKLKAILASELTNKQLEKQYENDKLCKWFAMKKQKSRSYLIDFGRFTELMARSPCDGESPQYPCLISFIGTTGVGKSTLIKALIKISCPDDSEVECPIIAHKDNRALPTTGDVHLYADPVTCNHDVPYLFADAEGLSGGNRTPANDRNNMESDSPLPVRPFQHTRLISWAGMKPSHQTRAFAANKLYPRMLYTFSDVVCLVTKEPKTMENDIDRLVRWGKQGLTRSLGQPVLPHAIIVVNALETDVESYWWDVKDVTDRELDSLDSRLEDKPEFQMLIKQWRECGRTIITMKDLLHCYYAGVSIVSIPIARKSSLFEKQLNALRSEIQKAATVAHDCRRSVLMRFDTERMNMYFRSAFKWFSTKFDEPFNYIDLSYAERPVATDFAQQIGNLGVHLLEKGFIYTTPLKFFNDMAYLIASYIMLDWQRKLYGGALQDVFIKYESSCLAGAKICSSSWLCEAIDSRSGARCRNRGKGHSAGHQDAYGRVFGNGNYKSTYNNNFPFFLDAIRTQLKTLKAKLFLEDHKYEDQSDEFEEVVLRRHLNTLGDCHHLFELKDKQSTLISHSTCFTCLMEYPQHVLPCGHVLCEPCVTAFSTVAPDSGKICLDTCPLCSERNWPPHIEWIYRPRPPSTGVRVLSLDGGGVRGIIQLRALAHLEECIADIIGARTLSVQSFFDLIVATDCGALIALGLGQQDWSVQACTKKFKHFMEVAFQPQPGILAELFGTSFISRLHGKYQTGPLRHALQQNFTDELFFGGPRSTPPTTVAKVAITAMGTNNKNYLLTNYNQKGHATRGGYSYVRQETPDLELKTWHCALASTATRGLFQPFNHESGITFRGARSKFDNPITIGEHERKTLWPKPHGQGLDFHLSLGTGFYPSTTEGINQVAPVPIQRGLFSFFDRFSSRRKASSQSTGKAQIAWLEFKRKLPAATMKKYSSDTSFTKYWRFSLALSKLYQPDDLKSLLKLGDEADFTFEVNHYFRLVARSLIASLFYFDVYKVERIFSKEEASCEGFIRCRLPTSSPGYMSLISCLKTVSTSTDKRGHRLGPFRLQAGGTSECIDSVRITCKSACKNALDNSEIPFEIHTRFRLPRLDAECSIALALPRIFDTDYLPPGAALYYPISNFPRVLRRDLGGNKAT